ncbi:HIT family protein [Alphaproteobacteria bacterium]|nr:HIT family protein [Alphaproteobacteria bacterium]
MEESTFTKIIKGEIPAHRIYEDDRVIAFLTIEPLFPGHTLVIPKIQVDHIWDLSDDDYEYLWKISRKLGRHIKKVLNPKRVGIVVEGFGVPHTHVHLVPINNSNDLKAPDQDSNDAELAAMAEKLRLS